MFFTCCTVQRVALAAVLFNSYPAVPLLKHVGVFTRLVLYSCRVFFGGVESGRDWDCGAALLFQLVQAPAQQMVGVRVRERVRRRRGWCGTRLARMGLGGAGSPRSLCLSVPQRTGCSFTGSGRMSPEPAGRRRIAERFLCDWKRGNKGSTSYRELQRLWVCTTVPGLGG